MANPHPNLANLKPWPKGYNPNPNNIGKGKRNTAESIMVKFFGRKKAREFNHLNAGEIDNWETFIISASVEDLQALVKIEDVPTYARNIMMAVLIDMKNGNSKTIEKLRDRQFGKAKKVEVTGADGAALIPEKNLTPEQAREFINKLNNEC